MLKAEGVAMAEALRSFGATICERRSSSLLHPAVPEHTGPMRKRGVSSARTFCVRFDEVVDYA
jgi:hypothetical protein